MADNLRNEKMHHLFCQHCKALQKITGMDAECWYNPMDEDKRLAFCAANIDAVKQFLNLFKAEVDKLTVIDTDTRNKVSDEALRSHYKETMDAKRVPSDYMLMFTEGGEANAISWAISYEQLQHTKKQLLDLMGE